MSLGHGAGIVRSGLVLHLDAANRKSYPGSGTEWRDLSGNGNNSTLVNGVGFDTANKGSLTFDGIDDYASINFVSPASAVTYEAFIKASNISKDQMYVGSSTSANYLRIVNSAAFLSIQTSVGQQILAHSQTLLNNTIYHIVSIYNGIQLKIYVNGSLTLGSVLNQSLLASNIDRIGRWRDADQRSFVGNIYCLRVYNRELSAAEIRQNFEATRSRYGI